MLLHCTVTHFAGRFLLQPMRTSQGLSNLACSLRGWGGMYTSESLGSCLQTWPAQTSSTHLIPKVRVTRGEEHVALVVYSSDTWAECLEPGTRPSPVPMRFPCWWDQGGSCTGRIWVSWWETAMRTGTLRQDKWQEWKEACFKERCLEIISEEVPFELTRKSRNWTICAEFWGKSTQAEAVLSAKNLNFFVVNLCSTNSSNSRI